MDTPEQQRYASAQAKLHATKEAAKDAQTWRIFGDMAATLYLHRPGSEGDPDADRCGTPWPCPTAERILRAIDA
ncbi:hypothetical protein [Streptomyces aureus]|uniref:hypothetical protein n=1 Tax=Streptomyces aureus TaxID=193461 RepID=UPI0033E78D2E